MASDFLDNLREICRPDGKAGRLSALLGAIEHAACVLQSDRETDPIVFAATCLRQMENIIVAKHSYDEAI